ncbi:TPA: hypothetical protein ACIJTV_004614 [Klebsiella pneumoniae]|mgnify:CR=1 FL=1|uniref:hypothetical protein n=1 Tax=Enterobacteriaceae TaxID=543 RepID=UPI001EFA47D8|nr:hypothetical protein [Klebsiella michiganensis]ELA2554986.1 hypothetical protein [Klebsiella pneumoniae]ELA2691734.1 hypothetical protein [Klebsiella pneumoniae]MCG8665416.1 hypothetical protein [Klebsiella michiganensis]HEJ8439669.1 hypothetical protein [Klebsiella oxytoca]
MHHVADRPEEEVRAIELYTLLGREGVQVRLNNISVKATSRWEQAIPLPPDYTGTPIDFLTDAEREERHLLLIGQMLCIDEQAEARDRIKQRLASRRKGSSQQNAD